MANQPFPFSVSEAFSVRGQAVLVTGAAGYIGRGIAEAFAANGARVLLTDLPHSPLATVAQRLRDQGCTAIEHACDLRVPDDLKALVAAGEAHFSGYDTIVHCGAIPRSGVIDEEADERFDELMQTNLRSTWLLIKYARDMFIRRGGGSVVNIASVNGHRAMFHGSLYVASKAAMISMTRELSSELAEHNIRLNTVSPGVIANVARNIQHIAGLLNPPYNEQYRQFAAELAGTADRSQPLPVGGTPTDIAMACIYLASPAARFITGADLLVEGGFLHAVFSDLVPPKPHPLRTRFRAFMRSVPSEGWKEGHPPPWFK